MKTPEEIKKGLEHCIRTNHSCRNCVYWIDCMKTLDGRPLVKDALTRIRLLETDNSCLNDTIRNLTELLNAAHEETAKVKRERDAAVKDIDRACGHCKWYEITHNGCTPDHDCKNPNGCQNISGINTGWEWRGICPENTEVCPDA